jgi:alpha-beta hydrolase superfamily lysophospholipase
MEYKLDFNSLDGASLQGTLMIPDAPPKAFLLFVHGITSSREEWGIFERLANTLASAAVGSFRFDYRCHGYNSLPFTELSLYGILSDIDAAWKAASRHPSLSDTIGALPLLVCGSSFGGGLVYRWASTHGNVRHAFLLAPVFDYWADITKTAPDWKSDLINHNTIDYAGRRLARTILHEAKYFQTVGSAGSQPVPALICHGTADDDVPIAMSQAVAFAHAHIELCPIEGAAHVLAVPGDLDMVLPESWRYVGAAQDIILAKLSKILGQ